MSLSAAFGLLALGLTLARPAMSRPDELLIDDFQRTDGLSALGTGWRFFADTVMGGVSRGQAAKSAREVRPGDRLTLQLPARELTVEVLGLPAGRSVARAEARLLFRVLAERRFDLLGNELPPG